MNDILGPDGARRCTCPACRWERAQERKARFRAARGAKDREGHSQGRSRAVRHTDKNAKRDWPPGSGVVLVLFVALIVVVFVLLVVPL